MKPTVTWILLADAQTSHVFVHEGPGKGLARSPVLSLTADPPVEYSDHPGRSFSSHGHGSSGMQRRDPSTQAEALFARTIATRLAEQVRASAFDRLILIAAPHMLGALREALDDDVATKVAAEIDKDLTKVSVHDLPGHLTDVIAI
jgi:protein required for attachment to host cells